MRIIFTEPFRRDYGRLPFDARRALHKALKFFITNPRHRSLRAKKLPGTIIWYARISRAYRFTFEYRDGEVFLRRAGTHDILSQERFKR
ncbi:hypothetical protein HY504_00995 [Candidatus Wolfebacteria bacterium]|nr:hypothetical protein [Candidatus Wolfebacteria bacterium]